MTQHIYKENGDHAVILFHAYTSQSNDFISVTRELTKRNYTVYAPTLSGHGVSDPSDILNYTIEDWVEDGREALEFIRNEGYEKISVFGLSLGGVIATALAMTDDDIQSFGTFSSPVMIKDKDDISKQFFKWFYSNKQELGIDEQQATIQAKEAVSGMKQMISHMNEYKQQLSKSYPNYTKEVFIAQGAKDRLIDPNHAKAFKNELKQAKVTFKWYEEGGHVITIGSVGKQLREDLADFLDNLTKKDG